MNILIVDDSEVMRKIVRKVVEENMPGANHSYLEASDGMSALSLAGPQAVDLILLDWNMPELDGLSVVKKLRSDEVDTPIIMVTSNVGRDKLMEAMEAGVTTYIEKPIRGQDLWEKIKGFF